MKNIVVPTDFSANARNALDYAINIANQLDECVVHLIHVFAYRSETGLMASVNNFMRKHVEENLVELSAAVESSLFNGTSLRTGAFEGYPIDTITEYAETVNANYIIMGTQGATGLKGIFMGSNTTGVIKLCSRPIIAIPSGYKYRPLNEIAFAVDSEKVNREKILRPLIYLAEVNKARVDILHVEKAKELATIDAGVDIYLSDLNHSFHYIEGRDVNKGINTFLREHNSDMLCMIHRRRSFLNRLIFESVTSVEALNCPVPLLILHDTQEEIFQ
jgi:nucleotide-binding universal stress UspA family protein